jgi:hypothetical protein
MAKLKFGQRLKQIIGTVAPVLGTTLGGPLGGMAGKMVQDALGVETDEAALEALQTPEGLAKLKDAEAQLKVRAKELDVDLEEIHQRDVADARAHGIAQRATGDNTTRNLAYIMIFAFIAVAAGILFGFTVADSTVAGTIIGYMVGEAKQVIAYYFGSSRGSKDKTDLLGGSKPPT